MNSRLRPATPDDVPSVAGIFGRAFEEYQHALGVTAPVLGELWAPSLAARITSTTVALTPEGRVAGFVITVKPGAKEAFGNAAERRRRSAAFRRAFSLRTFWRAPALFIPVGFALARRSAHPDELYISLIATDPDLQGRGFGQALLLAVEDEARAAGAAGILLHTASTNSRARTTYAHAGYELVCSVRAPWRGPAHIPAYLALRKPLRPVPTPLLDALQAHGRV